MGNKTGSKSNAQQNNYDQSNYNAYMNNVGNKKMQVKKQQVQQDNNNDDINNINQMQYQQDQAYNNSYAREQTIRRLNVKPQDANKQTVAVIVTFSSDGTYDSLFETVQQTSEQGTKVVVYKCSCYHIQAIEKAFNGTFQNQVCKQLITQINKVDPDCVVFNWECCGHYSSQNFKQGNKALFQFVKKMIDKKFMCMFSDFSLKALIKNWDQNILGPNPFKKIGQTSSVAELRFISGQLKQCPSAQLQTVGEMAEQGKVNVHCMGGTIMYSVNKKNTDHNKYKLQVLTVVTNIKVDDQKLRCKIGSHQGAAGHVLIKFPSGGHILTSMGHWIELMKVDTSQKKLFEVAAREYGQNYVKQQRMEYDNLAEQQKVSWRANKTKQFIQNQAPCTNMKKKSRM